MKIPWNQEKKKRECKTGKKSVAKKKEKFLIQVFISLTRRNKIKLKLP